jgi:2-polyprenyl-6-methoxyphenol hydroxylase-like FAD-dependent oxidoreductase
MGSSRSAPHRAKAKVLIIGGSMAGLFAALLLKRAGWDVGVYERIGSELSGRGAGIVTHRELFDVLEQAGIARVAATAGVPVTGRRVFGQDGALIGELPLDQIVTSWGHLYGLLRKSLADEIYHQGCNLERVEETDQAVVAYFADGSVEEADLLVGADGIFSTVRSQLLPGVSPTYVGYIAWRGLVDEADLSSATREALCNYFSFSLPEGEQILGYPVAGLNEELGVGERRFNFVWYRPAAIDGALNELLTDVDGVSHALSIPPNKIRPEVIEGLRQDACRLLAPQFAEVVQRTKQPFIQAIQDLETSKMAVGRRTVLIGDAAFVARPHVGAGVTKAAADAWALVEALKNEEHLDGALMSFEAPRLAVGRSIVARARRLGAYMQAQINTAEEKRAAELHRSPQAVMAETASMAFLEET